MGSTFALTQYVNTCIRKREIDYSDYYTKKKMNFPSLQAATNALRTIEDLDANGGWSQDIAHHIAGVYDIQDDLEELNSKLTYISKRTADDFFHGNDNSGFLNAFEKAFGKKYDEQAIEKAETMFECYSIVLSLNSLLKDINSINSNPYLVLDPDYHNLPPLVVEGNKKGITNNYARLIGRAFNMSQEEVVAFVEAQHPNVTFYDWLNIRDEVIKYIKDTRDSILDHQSLESFSELTKQASCDAYGNAYGTKVFEANAAIKSATYWQIGIDFGVAVLAGLVGGAAFGYLGEAVFARMGPKAIKLLGGVDKARKIVNNTASITGDITSSLVVDSLTLMTDGKDVESSDIGKILLHAIIGAAIGKVTQKIEHASGADKLFKRSRKAENLGAQIDAKNDYDFATKNLYSIEGDKSRMTDRFIYEHTGAMRTNGNIGDNVFVDINSPEFKKYIADSQKSGHASTDLNKPR